MKSLVYQTPVDTVEDLFGLVPGAAQKIQHVMEQVYQNVSRRYNVWNELGGRYIEPQLEWISTNHNLSTVQYRITVWLVCVETILFK